MKIKQEQRQRQGLCRAIRTSAAQATDSSDMLSNWTLNLPDRPLTLTETIWLEFSGLFVLSLVFCRPPSSPSLCLSHPMNDAWTPDRLNTCGKSAVTFADKMKVGVILLCLKLRTVLFDNYGNVPYGLWSSTSNPPEPAGPFGLIRDCAWEQEIRACTKTKMVASLSTDDGGGHPMMV